tara:strand:+ start:27 stop:1514 length:1488 start_codon:yes stop_codon:yes gene_type:complete
MKKNSASVAVIGSGIAGLSAAIRLSLQGRKVVVFEKNTYTGGKITAFEKQGFRFDMGPSLFTMPQLVEELFELAGKTPKDYFQYHTHDEVCRYFWLDGKCLTLYPSVDRNVEAITTVFGKESGRRVRKYFDDARKKFELTAPFFLESSLHKAKTFLSPRVLKVVSEIPRLGLFSTLDYQNKRYFKEPKLVQLFNRYATYNGSSPYQTPGIMQMISHLEHGMGTHFPVGGMHAISQSLTKLAQELGVQFELSSMVEHILVEENKVQGVMVNGTERMFDLVVCNSDIKHAYHELLPKQVRRPKKTLAQEPSSSALIFYWGIGQTFPEMDLHNIIFSEDYKEEFDRICSNGPFWEDPTIYIHISNRLEVDDAPKGKDSWFVMVNVPYDQGQDWEDIVRKVRRKLIERISSALGKDIASLIETEEILTPTQIQQRTSSVGGALYGTSSNERMAAFLRHSNKSSSVKGLYFCGGSAHPGGGVPLCILSGKIAAEWIKEDE